MSKLSRKPPIPHTCKKADLALNRIYIYGGHGTCARCQELAFKVAICLMAASALGVGVFAVRAWLG